MNTAPSVYSEFRTFVFVDTNVALECLALQQLPWADVDAVGPILLLVTPTVLKEVDGKKNHSRLGDHARRFNKLLRPLLSGSETVLVRPSPAPIVKLALAECDRIEWSTVPELDPDESDSRIIAEVLAARGISLARKIVVSNDIRPLDLARRHGLRPFHAEDCWLRPKEISEAERKAAALQRQLDAIKTREPELSISFQAPPSPINTYHVAAMTQEEKNDLRDTILRHNPMPQQKSDVGLHIMAHDPSIEERYEKYENKIVPAFVAQYERKLELNFGQFEIFFDIENKGNVPAESLSIRLKISGGFVNNRYILASPSGPPPPRLRGYLEHVQRITPLDSIRPSYQPGRHEFIVEEEPIRAKEVHFTCSDFRHGTKYQYKMIGWIDSTIAEEFTISVTATASNLYGSVQASISVIKHVMKVSVDDLVERETLRLKKRPPQYEALNAAQKTRNFTDFEFDGSDWDR
jgi:hypothetical protein